MNAAMKKQKEMKAALDGIEGSDGGE